MKRRKLVKANISFRRSDLWVGVRVSAKEQAIYLGIVPMFQIKVFIQDVIVCELCYEEMTKVAHHTGDGWNLSYDCDGCGNAHGIPWPFGEEWITRRELRERGFEVV